MEVVEVRKEEDISQCEILELSNELVGVTSTWLYNKLWIFVNDKDHELVKKAMKILGVGRAGVSKISVVRITSEVLEEAFNVAWQFRTGGWNDVLLTYDAKKNVYYVDVYGKSKKEVENRIKRLKFVRRKLEVSEQW